MTAASTSASALPGAKPRCVTGWGYSKQKFSPRNYRELLHILLTSGWNAASAIAWMCAPCWNISAPGASSTPTPASRRTFAPPACVDFSLTHNWECRHPRAYSSPRSFHAYDATQNGFSVSYAGPFRRRFNDDGGPVTLAYPMRFSAGVQE